MPKPPRKHREPEGRNAIITADMVLDLAPMFATVLDADHDDEGPLTVDVSARPGCVLVVLTASVTELDLTGAAAGQLVIFIVEQGDPGGFTWTAPTGAKVAGGTLPVGAVTTGHRDILTLLWDGEFWNETGRSLDAS